jgi:hypothetical protein
VRGPLQSFDLEAGPETLLACDAGVRHAVEAIDDAVCLVSVATGGAG